jgi:hypothetical protein
VEKSQSRVSVADARGQFANPEEMECPPLEAVTGSLTEDANVCVTVICKV